MNSSNTSLVLRVCRADGTSRGGFQWPLEVGAEVVAPDWKNNTTCGNGLHGWLYGQGDHSCVSYWADDAAKWLVLEVESAGIVMLDGKCKFERCIVRFVGNKTAAAAYVIEHEPQSSNVAVIGASLQVGAKQSGLVGALGTLTGGYGSILTGGDYSTLTGGYGSTMTGGDYSTMTGGRRSTMTGGDYSTLIGGDGSTLSGGHRSELRIRYWDSAAERYRTEIAYVRENGIRPNTAYKLDDNHQFMEVSK